MEISFLTACTAIITILITLVIIRYFYLVSRCGKSRTGVKQTRPSSTMIVLGSGGHTSEMMTLLSGMNLRHYTPRTYVVANTDTMSADKLRKFEEETGTSEETQIHLIPRAREVKQSYLTSVFSTLYATLATLPIVLKTRPDLLLCNGPGTCIPIAFWTYLVKFLLLKDIKMIYVESICRVEKLSLSGLLLYYLYMADHVIVQWPRLQKHYPRTQYLGRIV